jgi:hypothetical protein
VLVKVEGSAADEAYLLAVMSSIPFDWCSRRTVELHLTFDVLSALPIPERTGDSDIADRVRMLGGMLAAVDDRFSEWASEVGVPVGSVQSEEEKNELIYELDALVSLLYGLSEDQVVHIFETFHRGWDYKPRLEKVLDYYGRWKDKA